MKDPKTKRYTTSKLYKDNYADYIIVDHDRIYKELVSYIIAKVMFYNKENGRSSRRCFTKVKRKLCLH